MKVLNCKNNQPIAFKAGIVTVSNENHGKQIKEIVDSFNRTEAPEIMPKYPELQDKINYFVVAGGKGTRLQSLTKLTGDYNKVCFPFPIDDKKNLTMLDFPLAMGKFFIDKNGYKVRENEPKGNIYGMINYYLENPDDIKATVISGADLIYDNTAEEISEFLSTQIKNPDKHIAFIGTERTPEEVADKFGIFVIDKIPGREDVVKLVDFKEKPPIEDAKKYAVYNGNNIINTGLTYFSKPAMEKIMEKVKEELQENGEVSFLKKNDEEIYNGANAVEYILKNMDELFGSEAKNNIDVKIIKHWEDVGMPETYFRFLESTKNGLYTKNFSEEFAKKVKASTEKRVDNIDGEKYLLLSNKYDSIQTTPKETLKSARTIEGINVII